MTKDIQTILDRWIDTGEAKHSKTPVNMAGLSYIMVSPPRWDGTILIRDKGNKTTVVSFNDLLLDSNIFEVLEWDRSKAKTLYYCKECFTTSERVDSASEYFKIMCLVLPTQEQRVKYILDNLTEKE